MKNPLSFSLLFLAFSAGVLRSQSDSSLEKWWDGKRPNGTGLVQNATVLGLHFGVEF
jgi:hypothetical protein